MTARRVLGPAAAFLAVGLVWLATSVPADATTLRKMDLSQMVARADRVVHAQALSNRVYWDKAGRRIYTDTTFEVIEEAKGRGPNRLTVTMLGGRIDPVEVRVEGTPGFRPGEEVVLFTSPGPGGRKNLVGFSQGVMRVHVDEATGDRFATTEVPAGVSFVDDQGAPPASITGLTRMRAPLPRLLEVVGKMVEAGEAPGKRLSRSPERLDEPVGEERP